MKRIIFILTIVALGMTSCDKIEIQIPVEDTKTGDQVYHVCIPASMEADSKAVNFDGTTSSSTFSTSEIVYVYNATKTSMLTGYLSPTNLSNGGKNCDLTGDITGDIGENNELWLLYNTWSDGSIYYTSQSGLASDVIDGAKAVVSVTNASTNPPTITHAHFTKMQSVFRFKFVDESSNPISVSSLTIFNTNGAIIRSWDRGMSELGKIYVHPSPATEEYLYASICFYPAAHDGNKMVFIASDGTYLYRAKKAEPAAGFANGKYYYNTNPIQLTKEGALYEPTITWTTPSSPVALYENDYYGLDVDNAEVSVTGTSFGYRFLLTNYDTPSTIHLNNLTATRFEEEFVNSYYNSVTLDISGTNLITCDDTDRCAFALQNLKLRGNGTLTVTCNSIYECGLCGINNYTSSNNSYATTEEIDVTSILAVDGYTVTRSARTDNGDGSYTWTYTVTPATIDLSTLTSDYTAVDGNVLTGTLGSNVKISIEAGATVTLKGATINGVDDYSYTWAGLNCLGNATIILADGTTNTVKGFRNTYPGIHVPSGSTLTIQGTGALNASSNGSAAGIGAGRTNTLSCGNITINSGEVTATGGTDAAGIGCGNNASCGDISITGGTVEATGGSNGAGIGGSWNISCGTITISGGTVRATGGNSGAGIGSGANYSSCGNITISGGTIEAMGGSYAAGIGGGGSASSCSDITIENTVTSVTATKGSGATHIIGKGSNSGTCGTVKFGNVIVYNGSSWFPNPMKAGTYDLLTLAISTTTNTNDTWRLTPISAPVGVVAVDLGLPSGTLWASCNIGATTPEGYGDYFAWGEVEPYYSSLSPLTWKSGKENGYAWSSYRYDNSASHDGSSFSKYTGSDYSVLQPEDDAARYNWGINWRMPTNDELWELINNTDKEWTTINSVTGYKFKKKTDASVFIFLPSGIGVNGTSVLNDETRGEYWSSTDVTETGNLAYKAYFIDGSVSSGAGGYRCLGRNVRAVWAL